MDKVGMHVPESITDTEFQTSGRLSATELDEQRLKLLGNGAVTAILEALPDAVILFNEQRQAIHANAHALKMVDIVGVDGMIGLRLGEMLGCEHTVGVLEGCGGDVACQNCPAIQSMHAAMEGTITESPVTLILEQGGMFFTGKFIVRAARIHVDTLKLIMLILTPKSLVKRSTAKAS